MNLISICSSLSITRVAPSTTILLSSKWHNWRILSRRWGRKWGNLRLRRSRTPRPVHWGIYSLCVSPMAPSSLCLYWPRLGVQTVPSPCVSHVQFHQGTMPSPKTHCELISHVERNESPGFCTTGTFWAGRDHTKHFSSFYSLFSLFLFSFRTIIARVLYFQPLERWVHSPLLTYIQLLTVRRCRSVITWRRACWSFWAQVKRAILILSLLIQRLFSAKSAYVSIIGCPTVMMLMESYPQLWSDDEESHTYLL